MKRSASGDRPKITSSLKTAGSAALEPAYPILFGVA
jgi:hypothetical protein